MGLMAAEFAVRGATRAGDVAAGQSIEFLWIEPRQTARLPTYAPEGIKGFGSTMRAEDDPGNHKANVKLHVSLLLV